MIEAVDWTDHVPPLGSFGPGELEVTDPNGVCRLALGYSVELDAYTSLELQSDVARAMPTSFASNG